MRNFSMVKGPPLLRTTAAVTALDEVGPGMIPPLAILFSEPADVSIIFRVALPAPRNIPLTQPRPSKNSIHVCRTFTPGREKGKDHLPRWTKIEAASMAIVDPIIADKIARSQQTK
jgi:hypothetical protein